jgi:hypothetical protein
MVADDVPVEPDLALYDYDHAGLMNYCV